MNNLQTLLLKILEIINYTDDRETFASEFIKNIQIQSVIDLTNTLPPDKAEGIKKQLASAQNDQEKVVQIINSSFTKEQVELSLKKAAEDAVSKYIQAIEHTLADEQLEKIGQTFEKYSSPESTPSIPL